jgi:hypothetical protein
MNADQDKPAGCGGGCAKCPVDRDGAPEAGTPHGWRLVAWAAGVLLLPLVLAAGGAALGGSEPAYQFAGAMGGLSVGLIAAAFVAWLLRRGTCSHEPAE